MDINLPSELTSPRSSTAAAGDLLTQLRAAGTIEAEVIKVLQDSLLLRSRLGEILTRNTLNYKPGDRLYLRLDERGPTPVLKSSPAESRPVAIESRVYPEIARLLPPERPVLAKVLRVVAQQAEVRLAQTLVKLPPQVTAKRGELLRLARNDSRQQIDIIPLQAKAIYKALIKQLVPATRDSGRTSLVRLFDLLARAAGEIQPRAGAAGETARQPPSASAPASTRPRTSPSATAATDGRAPAARTAAAAPAPRAAMDAPAPAPKVQNSAFATGIAPIQRPPAGNGSGISRSPVSATEAPAPRKADIAGPNTRTAAIRQSDMNSVTAANTSPGPAMRSAPPAAAPVSAQAAATPRGQAQSPSVLLSASPAAPSPQASQQKSSPTPTPASAPITQPASTPRPESTPQTKRPAPGASSPAQGGGPSSPAPATPPGGAAKSAYPNPPTAATGDLFERGPAAPAARGEPAPLQKLLDRLLPRLPQFDAASLQRWFQAAKLVEATGTRSSPPMDIMQILTRLGTGDGFARELGSLLAAESRNRAEAESQPSRLPPEAPGPQIREGLRLVEQSLTQNLLQRATIGLQQETQQPLAFNLALPLLEQNEIKPLYIDLAQRQRAQNQNDRYWDIRIRFEFSALGPVCCHVVLEGSAVAASFYSERATTRADIDAALPELRRQLTDAGFEAGEFHSFSGGFKIEQSPLAADIGEALIDIEV